MRQAGIKVSIRHGAEYEKRQLLKTKDGRFVVNCESQTWYVTRRINSKGKDVWDTGAEYLGYHRDLTSATEQDLKDAEV